MRRALVMLSIFLTIFSAVAQPPAVAVANQPPVARFTATVLSASPGGMTVQFDGSASNDPEGQAVMLYEWDFGDGGFPVQGEGYLQHVYAQPGTYHVTLRVFDGSEWSEPYTAPVAAAQNAPPHVDFTVSPSTPIAGTAVTFTNGSSDPDGDTLSYSWSFGDGATSSVASPTHVYATKAMYEVVLTVSDGKPNGQVSKPVQLLVERGNEAPIASFTFSPQAPEVGESVTFTSTSRDGDGDPLTYLWNFGDGSSPRSNPATKTYTSAGPHTVTLTVTDSMGATNTSAPQTVTVHAANQPPTVQISAAVESSGPNGMVVRFNNSSRDPEGQPLHYEWNFGDGQIGTQSTEAEPRYTYAEAKNYTATLRVSDGRLSSEGTAQVTAPVNRPPVVKFSWTPAQPKQGETVTFSNETYDLDQGDSLKYTWSFGDGTPNSSAVNPTHVYNVIGLKEVTLIATDQKAGGTASQTQVLQVTRGNEAPVDVSFSFVPEAPEARQQITFKGAARDGDGDTLTYAWDFGDGTGATGKDVPKTYATAGTRTVTLTVTDSMGASAQPVRQSVTVKEPNRPPTPDFTWRVLNATQTSVPVYFDASKTTDLDGDPLTYTWKFGDPRNTAATGTGVQPQYTYPQPSTYTVELTVSDGRSPAVKVAHSVDATISTPNRRPSASFTWSPAQPTAGQLVTFTNTSRDDDGDALTYVWRFPDGTNRTAKDQLYTFATAGSHKVTLDVSDGNFPDASLAEHYITVLARPNDDQPPAANFSYSPSAPLVGQPVTFTDASADPNNDPLTYSWNFGDGTTSTTRHPVKTYSTAGSRVVSLSVSDGRNSHTVSKPITVSPIDGAPILTFDRRSGTVVTAPAFPITIEVAGADLQLSTGSVRLNDADVTASFSTPVVTPTRIVATATLQLRLGLNTLVAAVSDAAGRRGQSTLTVTYQVDDGRPVLRFDRASGTTVTDPAFPVVITATGTDLSVSTGAIHLNGTPVTSSFAIPEATSTRVVASGTLQLAAGPNTIVAAITDAAGRRGEASLTVTYNDSAAGLANPTVTAPGNMSVTPGAQGTVKFQVKNNSTTSRTFAFVATSSNAAVVTDPADPISQIIPAGATIDVPVSASVLSGASAGATSTIALTATDTAGTSKTGRASFVATVSLADFELDLSPHNGENVNIGQFGASLSYATPAYISMDTPRSVTLFYSSAQANPKGFVQVDVRDNGATPAQHYSLLLRDKDDKLVPLTTGTTEAFYEGGSGVSRLAAQFDAATLATGAYTYTLVVRKWIDGKATEYAAPVRVLIVNEIGSPYGAGWTLGGLMRLHRQADGVTVTLGDGTVQFFAPERCDGTTCRYASPKAVFVQSLTSDSSGFVLSGHDGAQTRFDSNGFLQSAVDRFGNAFLFQHDSGRLAAIEDPAGKRITLTYAGGRLSEIRDAASPARTVALTIDAAGDIREIREPDGSTAVRADYDSHRLAGWFDRGGNRTDIAYDSFGWLERTVAPTVKIRTEAGADADARPVHSSLSLPAALLPPAGRGATPATAAARVLPTNVRVRIIDAGGQTTSILPDRFGNPLRIEGPLGVVTTFERDAHSRITRQTQAPVGGAYRNEWHATLPLLTRQIDETTAVETTYEYDSAAFHQVKRVSSNRADLPERRYFYDSAGNLERTASIASDGSEVAAERVTFYPDGRLKTSSDAEGHITSYEYQADAWRNIWKVVEAPDAPRVHTYHYDGAGRASKVTLPSDGATSERSVSLEYDLLNRRWKRWTDLSDYQYDLEEHIGGKRVRTVKDAEGNAHVYTYNALGWLESERDPLQRATTYRYDAAGFLRERVDRRNHALQMTYDALGRLRSRLDVGTGEATEFEYDPQGRWMQVSNAESVNRFEYDQLGRQTHEHITIEGVTYTLESLLDERGKRKELRLKAPWQRTVIFDYDRDLKLSAVVDPSGGRTIFERDDDGVLERLVYPNGMAIRYNVSSHHSISGISPQTAALNQVFGTSYGINAQGQVSARWNAARDNVTSYAYDPAGRLKEMGIHTVPAQPPCDSEHSGDCAPVPHISTGLSVKYNYDLAGNPAGTTVVAQPANRLRAMNGMTMDYDVAGNLISMTGDGSAQTFVWNALGQLRQVSKGTSVVTFGYDGLGRRVRKTAPSGVTRYVHDGNQLFMELDLVGNILREYTFLPGIDDPLSVRHGGRTYYYMRERPGHVSGLVDDTGTSAVNVYRYDPWGKVLEKQESIPNPLMFGAREYDAETGLYYNRARYYSPTLRRFISEDPLGVAGGLNLYAYADNDPVNRTDPTGLSPCMTLETFKTLTKEEKAGVLASNTVWCIGGGPTALDALTVLAPFQQPPFLMPFFQARNWAQDLNYWGRMVGPISLLVPPAVGTARLRSNPDTDREVPARQAVAAPSWGDCMVNAGDYHADYYQNHSDAIKSVAAFAVAASSSAGLIGAVFLGKAAVTGGAIGGAGMTIVGWNLAIHYVKVVAAQCALNTESYPRATGGNRWDK